MTDADILTDYLRCCVEVRETRGWAAALDGALEQEDKAVVHAIESRELEEVKRRVEGFLRCKSELLKLLGSGAYRKDAVSCFRLAYLGLQVAPELIIGHPVYNRMWEALFWWGQNAASQDSEELRERVSQRLKPARQEIPFLSEGADRLLSIYEEWRASAQQVCKGRVGLNRQKAVLRAFPEVERRWSGNGRKEWEPQWVALNAMAVHLGTNPHDLKRLLMRIRKYHKAADCLSQED